MGFWCDATRYDVKYEFFVLDRNSGLAKIWQVNSLLTILEFALPNESPNCFWLCLLFLSISTRILNLLYIFACFCFLASQIRHHRLRLLRPKSLLFSHFSKCPPPPSTHLADSNLVHPSFLPRCKTKLKWHWQRVTSLVDGEHMLTVLSLVKIKTAMLCKKFTFIPQVGAYNPTPDSPFKKINFVLDFSVYLFHFVIKK